MCNSLRWRHNERDGVSNHQPHNCLFKRLFRHRWKETSKLCVTGLCAGNSPVTGVFLAQRASNAENDSFDDVITSPIFLYDPYPLACIRDSTEVYINKPQPQSTAGYRGFVTTAEIASGHPQTTVVVALWRHDMETSAEFLALWKGNPLVASGFHHKRLVMRCVDFFFIVILHKPLSKQPIWWWFETP